MHALVRAAALAAALSAPGCATIMAGGPDHVSVATNPPGATVFVDELPVGQTPAVVVLDRERGRGVIRLEYPGFAPVTFVRTKSLNGWVWANLCIGGLIGIVVDVITGNAKTFDETPIAVGLTPVMVDDTGAPVAPIVTIAPIGTPLPAPKDEHCQARRAEALAEARQIRTQYDRMKALAAVPNCP